MRSIEVEPPRPIEEGDDISGFRSGVEKVDAWLKDRAMGARSAGSAVVYVTLHKGRVVGYYSLSAQSITRKRAMGWLGRNSPDQIPVILLGMLGVDTEYQGIGLGTALLRDASRRALRVSQQVGARALVVDPIDESAAGFYRTAGFREIPGTSRMYAMLAHPEPEMETGETTF